MSVDSRNYFYFLMMFKEAGYIALAANAYFLK